MASWGAIIAGELTGANVLDSWPEKCRYCQQIPGSYARVDDCKTSLVKFLNRASQALMSSMLPRRRASPVMEGPGEMADGSR